MWPSQGQNESTVQKLYSRRLKQHSRTKVIFCFMSVSLQLVLYCYCHLKCIFKCIRTYHNDFNVTLAFDDTLGIYLLLPEKAVSVFAGCIIASCHWLLSDDAVSAVEKSSLHTTPGMNRSALMVRCYLLLASVAKVVLKSLYLVLSGARKMPGWTHYL